MALKCVSATDALSLNRIHLGDARELAPRLVERSISVTLTSPPYWALKDYGTKKQIGHGQSYEDYLQDLVGVFRDVYRATRDTGSLWVVLDSFKIEGRAKLLPFEFSTLLQKESDWILQDVAFLRGGSGNSDSVVSGRLASPPPPRGGRREERGNETNETESRSDL